MKAPNITNASGYSEKNNIPKIVAKIKSKYVNGARKEASDFLSASTKEKCPKPPKTPRTENNVKSRNVIGSKNGIKIKEERKVPTNDV